MDSGMVDNVIGLDDAAMADAMDDLFGEATEPLDLAAGVHLPTISAPLPSALLLRLAEMQALGCCTELAWSNSGSIARISSDGSTIDFYVYAVEANTGDWKLSGPSSHPIVATDHHRFVHVQFNLLGHELAVVDEVGHTHIYALPGGIGRMLPSSVDTQPHLTELDAVVGLHWLPIVPLDCRSLYIGPVSRSVNGWTSQSRPREQNAIKVHHPADNAKALILLTRKGTLTLRYQQDGWRSLSHVLYENEALISHADFCEHNGHILLAAFDAQACLTLYQVAIVWNATYTPGPNQTQQVTAIDPRMQVTRLTSTSDTAPRHMLLSLKPIQLQLLPPTAEVVDGDMTPTTVLATFVQPASHDDALGSFNDSATILVRWHVDSDPRTMHESFKKLKPGSTTFNVTIDKTVLRRQPDLITPKIVLSTRSKYFDTLLMLVASDGTIEVRDRASFEILEPYMDSDHVSTLVQSGFAYDVTAHNVHAAVSNDGSAMVHQAPSEELQVTKMTLRYGWQAINGGPNHLAEAAIVCVARQYMIMTCSYSSPDELLSVLPASLPDDLHRLLCHEAFRLARHGPDISSFDERFRQGLAIKEPLMPKAYGLQLGVGTDLATSRRSLSGQLAWAVLNLRHVCFSVSQSLNRLDPSQPFPSEPIHSLRGQCRWGVDLIVMIIGALQSVVEKSSQESAVKLLNDHMRATSSPIFLLLLCSLPRTLLKVLVQFIPRLIKFSQISSGRARSVLERQQLTEIGLMEKTVPFTFESFRTFLDNVESTLHSTTAQHDSLDQTEDTIMSLTGTVPDELEKRVRALVVTAIPSLLDAADLSRIYFADTSWLGLAGPASVQVANKYDVLQKLPLSEKAVVRKCRRCGSMMEELNMDKPREVMPWLFAAQRNCVCTCNWYIP